VREAGITSAVPFRGVDWLRQYQQVGSEKLFMANQREVDPEYFSVMRLMLLRGRLLTDRDTASSEPVVVISESVARQAFPGEEPIGKQLDFPGPRTIVGVVKDVRYKGLDQPPSPAIYVPAAQSPRSWFAWSCEPPSTAAEWAPRCEAWSTRSTRRFR